jgi:hypothetical protein
MHIPHLAYHDPTLLRRQVEDNLAHNGWTPDGPDYWWSADGLLGLSMLDPAHVRVLWVIFPEHFPVSYPQRAREGGVKYYQDAYRQLDHADWGCTDWHGRLTIRGIHGKRDIHAGFLRPRVSSRLPLGLSIHDDGWMSFRTTHTIGRWSTTGGVGWVHDLEPLRQPATHYTTDLADWLEDTTIAVQQEVSR